MRPISRVILAVVLGTGLAAPLAAQQGRSMLRVHVLAAATGLPIADAEVILDERTGLGVTDANGVLRARGLVAGPHRLRVRFIGYATSDQVVDLPAGGALEETVQLEARAIPIDSLTVVAYRGTLGVNMRAFAERRGRGNGYFFTRDDIDRVKPHMFSDLLRLVPGMRFDCASFRDDCSAGMSSAPPSGVATRREGGLAGALQDGGCPIQYYVDGHYEPHSNVNDINPTDVAAVEVYVHGAQAPARYSIRKNARCGVVLVWLRQSLGG